MMKKGFLHKLLALPFSARQGALASNRAAISHNDFISSITHIGGDAEAAGLVHSKLQRWICHDGFTPYPDDSLGKVFGIAEEELDEDLILDIFIRLGVSPPSPQQLKAFGPLDTATDIARLVTMARKAGLTHQSQQGVDEPCKY